MQIKNKYSSRAVDRRSKKKLIGLLGKNYFFPGMAKIIAEFWLK
jgi:hypothetical protein